MKSTDQPYAQKAAWARWIGVVLGVLALAFYCGSVLRVDYVHSKLPDLHPNPDASEYFAMAQAMANGESPKIQIGDERLPARYSPGYSVLMLPWFKILPKDQHILAPFRTSQTMGLLLLCSLWIFYWKQGLPLGGGIATLLVATLPGFVSYSRSSMSEISGITLLVWAFMAAYIGLQKKQRLWIYGCAFLLGLAVNVRTQFILFGPVLTAMALIGEKDRRKEWVLHCAGVLLLFAFCITPVFTLNAIQFGSPFQTGYIFWVPEKIDMAVSVHHFKPVLAGLWRELSQQTTTFTATHVFGTGAHFTAAYLLLALIGFAFHKDRKFFFCAGFAWSCVATQSLFFYYADGRLFLPLIILVVPIATLPVMRAARAISQKKYLPWILILVLFGLAIAGFPSQSGYPQKSWRSQCIDSLSLRPLHKPRGAPHTMAAHEMAAQAKEKPGLVLSIINPVFLNAILPNSLTAAPIDGRHLYAESHSWRYTHKDAIHLAKQSLTDEKPVYALFVPNRELEVELKRLPQIRGCHWGRINPTNRNAVILQLQMGE